jgi:hypothetical protein
MMRLMWLMLLLLLLRETRRHDALLRLEVDNLLL